MKTVFAFLVLAFGLSAHAAQTVTGDSARSIMEALAGAGVAVSGIDQEWATVQTLTADVADLRCQFSAQFPDEWAANVACTADGQALKNPLAVFQVLKPYTLIDAASGVRFLTVQKLSCTLTYSTRDYSCSFDAQ